jgi:hypothetical protein
MSGISYYQVSFEILFHRLTAAAAAASSMKLDQHLFSLLIVVKLIKLISHPAIFLPISV